MIKINLAIKEEKKGKVSQEWIVVGFFSAIVLIVMIGIYLSNNGKITHLRNEIKKGQAEKQKLDKTIATINQLKKRRDNLEKKNKVIDNLNRGRQLWPKIMRMLVDSKPEQLWVQTVSGNANQVRLDGSCFSHLNVAQFMENLKSDPLVANVVLIRTVAGGSKTAGGGDLVTFSLQIHLKK